VILNSECCALGEGAITIFLNVLGLTQPEQTMITKSNKLSRVTSLATIII
jgi:hypothetical protein